jgi:type I restriction enzyme, S subunit
MNNWRGLKIRELAITQSGGTPSTTRSDYWDGDIPWINSGELKDCSIKKASKYITKLGLDSSSARLFPINTVVIALTGATTAKLGVLEIETSTNQSITGILPNNEFNSKFLFYQLLSLRREIISNSLGTAQPHINKRIVDEILVKLPAVKKQQTIVTKIEELLSDLENGKQQLQLTQQQLKVYRQSLLKWAFEGKLTNENLNGEFPKGWECVKLGSVLDKIEAGKSFKCDERTPKLNEVGVLKVSAVTWQIFNEIESKTVIEKDRINEAYFVKKDDFLFSRANTLDLIGAVVLVNSIERKLMLSDKTLRFRFSSNILKSYILYYLRSKKGRYEIQRLSTGNQESMRNIGQERIRQIEFPLCSLNEQQLIVNELESRLTVCDKIEETINQSLQQVETLRQSILKKAFEGEL